MHEQPVEDCAKFQARISKSLGEEGIYRPNLENKLKQLHPTIDQQNFKR